MIDINTVDHAAHMKEALGEAEAALRRGDRPIGCVIVHGEQVVGRGSNHEFTLRSKFEHAETRAMRRCAEYLFANSNECVLYSTVEPCVMCLGTIVMANIRHVVYGVADPVAGGSEMFNRVDYVRRSIRGCYLGGILTTDCQHLLDAFRERSRGWGDGASG